MSDSLSSENTLLWQKADWANGAPFYNAWCPQQVSFGSDLMLLSLERISCHNLTHASGEYRTNTTYRYGTYTARLKASDANGTITSFFTYTGPAEGTEHDEIDIEIFGKDPTKMQANYWRNGIEHPTIIDLGFDASLAFHTYAFSWSSLAINWYVDDILVHTEDGSNGPLPLLAGKIIMNLWACTGIDAWCGSYTDGTAAHAAYDSVQFQGAY